jgi:hypothetical protein
MTDPRSVVCSSCGRAKIETLWWVKGGGELRLCQACVGRIGTGSVVNAGFVKVEDLQRRLARATIQVHADYIGFQPDPCDARYEDVDIFLELARRADAAPERSNQPYLHLRLTRDTESNHTWIVIQGKCNPDGVELGEEVTGGLPREIFEAFADAAGRDA